MRMSRRRGFTTGVRRDRRIVRRLGSDIDGRSIYEKLRPIGMAYSSRGRTDDITFDDLLNEISHLSIAIKATSFRPTHLSGLFPDFRRTRRSYALQCHDDSQVW
jgi:hypothetical protein